MTSASLAVMNYLNGIADEFPDAVSFASGRPTEAFFRFDEWMELAADFAMRMSKAKSWSPEKAGNYLSQYGPTNGIINDLLSRQLEVDEGIRCDPHRIVITSGCQEALALCVRAVCTEDRDVILTRDPTYVGITGAADFAGVDIEPIECGIGNSLTDSVSDVVSALKLSGRRPRVFYLIPDFDNPTGVVIPKEERQSLLAFCAENEILILEDSPYRMFHFDSDPPPSMMAMDAAGCVLHLGTVSKTLCPTLRVGFVAVPKTLFGSEKRAAELVERIGIHKSFVTLNTCQFSQAIVGTILIREGGSLRRFVEPAVRHYRRNRDLMTQALKNELRSCADSVTWNQPQGGFFMYLDTGFPFGEKEMRLCAREFGVLVMPMQFFSVRFRASNAIRLSYSNVDEGNIRRGVRRLAAYLGQDVSERRAAECDED